MCLICSLHLASMDLPICPTYTFPHSHGIQYKPWARCKEHMRHIRLDQLEKSTVAEHSVNTGHQIDFSNITILDRTLGYMD
jgi:hypothetical protein